jgi:hypothetical protein
VFWRITAESLWGPAPPEDPQASGQPPRFSPSDSGRDPSRPNGDAPKVGEAVLGETETPHSAAVKVIPGSPLAQRSAADEAAPPQQNRVEIVGDVVATLGGKVPLVSCFVYCGGAPPLRSTGTRTRLTRTPNGTANHREAV